MIKAFFKIVWEIIKSIFNYFVSLLAIVIPFGLMYALLDGGVSIWEAFATVYYLVRIFVKIPIIICLIFGILTIFIAAITGKSEDEVSEIIMNRLQDFARKFIARSKKYTKDAVDWINGEEKAGE